MHCYDMNMFVIAACYDLSSDGAKNLQIYCEEKRFLLVQLDIRRMESIQMVYGTVCALLKSNPVLGIVLIFLIIFFKLFLNSNPLKFAFDTKSKLEFVQSK